jgi:AcrR family transcriptional regulator
VARSTAPDRRNQILDALFAAMAAGGTAGASVTEIADRAGVARGALHYFFASKDEITAALMQRLGHRYLERLGHALSRAKDKQRSIADTVARFHFGSDDGDMSHLLGVWIDFWGQAPSRPNIQQIVAEVQHGARQLLSSSLPTLGAAQSAMILAVVEGSLLQWRVALGTSHEMSRAWWCESLRTTIAAITTTTPARLPSPVHSHAMGSA